MADTLKMAAYLFIHNLIVIGTKEIGLTGSMKLTVPSSKTYRISKMTDHYFLHNFSYHGYILEYDKLRFYIVYLDPTKMMNYSHNVKMFVCAEI